MRDDEIDLRVPKLRKRGVRKKSSAGKVKRRLIIAGVIAGVVFVALFIILIPVLARSNAQSRFAPHIEGYLAGENWAAGEIPPSVGKMVVVNIRDKDLDTLHFDLPGELRASEPEEVTTVVRIVRRWPTYGEYTNHTKGLQHHCGIEILDRKSNRIRATRNFYGSPPPDRIYKSPTEVRGGEVDDEEVLKYLVEYARNSSASP